MRLRDIVGLETDGREKAEADPRTEAITIDEMNFMVVSVLASYLVSFLVWSREEQYYEKGRSMAEGFLEDDMTM
jgi:hypothetical protein